MRQIVVIPCFNEAKRIDADQVLTLAAVPGTTVVLVDDGSTDDTLAVLDGIAARAAGSIQVVRLRNNVGKGEAVRAGLLLALHDRPHRVAYLDADFSAPPAEMLRVLEALDQENIDVALGSRVQLLGRRIERKPLRHYLGRAFATAASLTLAVPIYDTQCGAKAFRCTPALEQALSAPFISRWAFDVELIGRLLRGGRDVAPVPPERFVEVPMSTWRDIGSSRLSGAAMVGAAIDLVRIGRKLRQ